MAACYLIYDIETVPETEIAEEWRSSDEYEKERQYQKCAEGEEPFPPLSCHKIVTIATALLDENLHIMRSGVLAGGSVKGNERAQVEKWDELVQKSNPSGAPLTIVDWNGKKFDAPVIQYRAFRYGIPLKWYFGKMPDNKGQLSTWSKSYRDRFGGGHLDLVDDWTNSGAARKCHLKELAQLMGLPGKTGIDGSKVYGAWKEGRHEEIDSYCLEDVWHTAFVKMRIDLLAGRITADQYIGAAQLLVTHITDVGGHTAMLDSINEDRLFLKA